ncbi:MAG: flagellar biosynthetic protein FliR [Planctomycetota bacterium]|nr:flagellar biosynthetic protein FliR [Planctomycetota bacterium]
MNELLQFSANTWAVWVLVFLRISGAMMVLPIFSSRILPMRIKGAIAALIALCVAPVIWSGSMITSGSADLTMLFASPLTAAVAICGELALGWVLGATAAILMWCVHLGGQLLSQDSGLAFGQVVDPSTGQSTTPLTTLLLVFAGLIFLALEGHRLVLLSLCGSFEAVPPGVLGNLFTGALSTDGATLLTSEMGSQIWNLGFQIALPASIALLVTTLGLGILSRSVPEMNVFIVGFSIRTGVGMLVLFVTLPFIAEVYRYVIEIGFQGSELILQGIRRI